LSAQQFGIDSFAQGVNGMPGVIEFPGSVDPLKMRETATLWQRARRKGGTGLPGVLEGGGTFRPTGITNEAAQFLETRQWTAAEICAQVYLVDPRELGIPLTGSTLEYTNSESRLANLVRKGMLRWIVRVEAAVSGLLPQPQYMKFNVNGFLRGDSGERWATYLKASQINTAAAAAGQKPVLLTDEMRDWEDLDPIPESEMPAPPDAQDDSPDPQPVINVDARTSPTFHVDNRQEPPVVNVATPPVRNEFTMPDIHVDARQEPAVVNVDARQAPAVVNVDARQEPPVVNVAAPNVTVKAPAPSEQRATRKTIEHTADGRIAAIIEETI